MRQSTAASGKWLVGTIFLLGVMLTMSGWLARSATSEQRQAEEWEEHTFVVLDTVADIRLATVSIRRGERGYLITEDPTYLSPYTKGRQQIEAGLPRLAQSVADNPEQINRFAGLARLMGAYLQQAATTVDLAESGQRQQAIDRVRTGEGRILTERVLAQLDTFEAAERDLLEQRQTKADRAAQRSDKFQGVLTISGLLLLAIGLLASITLRGALKREAVAHAALKRLATTDELTGLDNRREMFAGLDRLIPIARRSGRPLSVGVIDIDRFKLVNDTYGHPAGDEVIRRVADMARELMRQQDLVGRLGGEEFLVVFPDCTAAEAAAACERLRQGIAALPIMLPDGTPLSVTVSSGLAQLDGADDRTRLIGRADEALYAAKKAGRDQVKLAA